MRLPPQQKMCAAIYNFWETLTVFCSFAVLFSMKRPHKRSIDEAPYGLMSVYERNESRPHKNVSLCVPQSAVSRHNMSYWKGRQYIGVGPGDLLSRLLRSIHYCTGGNMYFCPATGAHGRFVLRGEGGVVREARTQTLEPDVWICEVQQRGHGTRRRIQLGHLELWVVALRGSRVVSGNEYIYIYIVITRGAVVSTNSEPVWNVAIIYQPSPQSVWLNTAWDACWRSLYMCLFFQTFCPCETL